LVILDGRTLLNLYFFSNFPDNPVQLWIMGIILGIDPGTIITGYGLIDRDGRPVDFGCIRPPASLPLAMRYKVIFEGVEALIARHQPIAVAVEAQFVLKNPQSAIKLGMAKGMVYLAAAKANIPIYEYAPKKAKQAVVGNGSASKFQVQKMIQALLRLPQIPEPEDAADALALAICCAHELKVNSHVRIDPRNSQRQTTVPRRR
jgi:crossover junction endodeoxyribonuclease RuvC